MTYWLQKFGAALVGWIW